MPDPQSRSPSDDTGSPGPVRSRHPSSRRPGGCDTCPCGGARRAGGHADHEKLELLGLGELRRNAGRRGARDHSAGPCRIHRPLKDRAGNSFEAVHRDGKRPEGAIDHVAIRVEDVAASTAFYSTVGPAAGLTMRRQSADRSAFSVGASDGSLIVIAGEPTRTSTSPSRAKTRRTYAGSTLTRVRRDTATTASRASARATTRATTPRMCSTPTATTSKSSTTAGPQSRRIGDSGFRYYSGHSRDTLDAATQAHPRHLGDARWLPTGERLGGRSPAGQAGRWGRPGSRRRVQLTASTVSPASAAVSMSFTTSAGWETIARCPDATSAIVAPMRLANMR